MAEFEGRPVRIRGSLTLRILAVNLLALLVLASSVFYLDGYRARLIDERRAQLELVARLIGRQLSRAPAATWPAILADVRAVRPGLLLLTNGAPPLRAGALALVDPASEPWRKGVARTMDRIIDRLVDAPPLPAFLPPMEQDAGRWREFTELQGASPLVSRVRYAPDRTHVVSAAARIGAGRTNVLVADNARDIVRLVRAERLRLGRVVGLASLLSAALSYFFARTIVVPLRRLARAAVRVRLGRAREVVVPRLPSRRDEIGLLARALSDMTAELRDRIDAIEGFAADVSHELKNPLASLRSAVETLARVDDPGLRERLLAILRDDVVRLDRLITDIAEMSRLDAQLTRTPFAVVDLGDLLSGLLRQRETRVDQQPARIAFARPYRGLATVLGDADRLGRAIDNLLDNAVSFSPPGGVVRVGATRVGDEVIVTVEDEGPGVPVEARERIFNRFHSDRPQEEEFGRHSGLGLAIARTIVEGHRGRIEVADRSGQPGARFVVSLPAV